MDNQMTVTLNDGMEMPVAGALPAANSQLPGRIALRPEGG